MTKKILALLLSLIGAQLIAQNTGTLRGFVYESEKGTPVIFTNVFLKGTPYGAVTDVNGYYSMSKIPVGDYELICYSLGFDTLRENIRIKGDEIINKKLVLSKSSIELSAVEISAEKQTYRTEVKMSSAKVTSKEIKSLPSVGGESDIAQYLQVLPGVVFTGDQGGQLYIRGGSPVQNRVLFDGMVIFNPFHSIGLFSIFETEIIRNADVSTGGFSAQYGSAISSVIDITTRDGNPNRFSGKFGASTIGAKLVLEGPLKKAKEAGGSYISYVLSGKTSYLDQTSQSIYSYIEQEEGLPYSFTDLYGKLAFHGDNGSQFDIFGYSNIDNVDFSTSKLDWRAYGGGSKFILVPSNSALLLDGRFSYSFYDVEQITSTRNRRSSISNINAGIDFSYFIKDDQLKYGLDILVVSTDFDYINSVNRRITEQQNNTEIAGYASYNLVAGNWVVMPSLRAIYYASLNEPSLEPRLGIKYNVSNNLRVKAAGGLYSQNVISSNTDLEVVNLFNGYLSSPSTLQSQFREQDGSYSDVNTRLQKAIHYIVGFEFDFAKYFSLNVEGYYKDFRQLININRYKILDDTPENNDASDFLKKDFLVEKGYAYGADITLKYRKKMLDLWAVYSYGYTRRWDGLIEYFPVFDRRHNLNLVGSYTFGNNLDWKVSARFNFGSGFPFTQTRGYYENFDFADDITSDPTTGNGNIGSVIGEINDGRLPDYARFDVDISKDFALSAYSTLQITAGVTNMFNRENIFYYDLFNNERINQLPILPSIGFNISF
ncbi:MAG TPA: TonB-dependent receptor [Flavobacteriales bacterium]|jgi:hypothetical protein|nr:TonB-dependent receptor [Flavobacteriales bacterium]